MSCMCVVSDDRPRRTTACVRYGEPIERAFVFFVTNAWVGAVRIDSTGVSCVNVWNHCVYTSSSTPIARMHSFVRVPGHGTMGNSHWEWMVGWMHGVRAFMSSVVDARGDGRIRETHRARPSTSFASNASLPRLSRSLSLSNDEFIHSLIHSFIPLRTNERTKGRTNERTTGRAREGRERDGLDRRVRSHPIARAREEVRASVSNARRIERIESRVHFKPPIHRRRSRRMRRGMNATE